MAFEKRYIGSGKEVPNYPNLVEVSINYDKLQPFEFNGQRYVKFTVGKKKETDQHGKTHAVWVSEKVDDGNPTNNMNSVENPSYATKKPDYPEEDIAPEDIPF